LTSRMFENTRFGARNSIPLSTNFKVAKHFSVSVGGSYEDVWAIETYERGYDPDTKREVVTDTINGFDRFGTYNFSASIGTTLYGLVNFGEDKKIQAIRHVMRPSVSYGYTPSFDQYYDSYIGADDELELYSRFEGTLNGAPGLNKSSSMSFSLGNQFEAKVRDKDSTATKPKKISLLSNLNLSTGYNFEADSLKLSPLNLSGGTNILNNKMAINFGASFDPYAIDNNGTRINTFNVDNGGSLFRLTTARANLSYSLSSETFGKKKDEKKEDDKDEYDYVAASGGRDDDLFGRANDFNENRPEDERDKDSEDVENPVYGTKLPWDLRLAYAVNYSNSNRQNTIGSHSLMFSGNIQLSPRWKIGGSSGYDFKNKGFTLTQLRFERDLKSFRMNFNWTPFGTYKRWYFFIGIKSSILQDLKWENRSKRN